MSADVARVDMESASPARQSIQAAGKLSEVLSASVGAGWTLFPMMVDQSRRKGRRSVGPASQRPGDSSSWATAVRAGTPLCHAVWRSRSAPFCWPRHRRPCCDWSAPARPAPSCAGPGVHAPSVRAAAAARSTFLAPWVTNMRRYRSPSTRTFSRHAVACLWPADHFYG